LSSPAEVNFFHVRPEVFVKKSYFIYDVPTNYEAGTASPEYVFGCFVLFFVFFGFI